MIKTKVDSSVKGLKWEGQDGVCPICGFLVSEHPDWALPNGVVVKYCDGKRNKAYTCVWRNYGDII